ncbi:MAG: DUF3078 domain-containing protein [Paludibacteraceae bacterium]|nr:DUF3078 domain-containing protein [Paludibacteraceae bacterium]
MKKLMLLVAAFALVQVASAQGDFVDASAAAAATAEAGSATAEAASAAADAKKTSEFWKRGLDVSLQGTQTFVTPNWYNGGNSNVAGLFGLKGWFNYAKEKWAWDNLVELKYGVTTTFSEDKYGRLWHLTDDKTAYSTKLGYNIGKGWNVAANADFETTLFNNYQIDSPELVSGLFSPIRFYAGVGVDYKYHSDAHKLDFSVMIAPYAYRLVYVYDLRAFANATEDGLTSISDHVGVADKDGNAHVITDQTAYDAAVAAADWSAAANYYQPTQMQNDYLGSRIKAQYRQEFNDKVSLESTLSFYTNYKGIEVDWEVIADFKLYKLLTARVSLNPRYDSTGADGWDSKIQFKEFVSLGLAYRLEK